MAIKLKTKEVIRVKKFNISNKLVAVANILAMALVIQTSNATCLWMFNQPEFPEEARKYSRI